MIADLDCEKVPAEALQDVDSAECDGVEELFVGNVLFRAARMEIKL